MRRRSAIVPGLLTIGLLVAAAAPADAASRSEIDSGVKATLDHCFANVGGCKLVGGKAKGILVFPEITQAGVGIGGAHGEGALKVDGKTVAYYSLTAGSIGLQLGAQKFSQVVMFMTDESLSTFCNSSGWEAGATAQVTWIDQGTSSEASTLATDKPVIGFTFGEQGLMGAAVLGGTKISRIEPGT